MLKSFVAKLKKIFKKKAKESNIVPSSIEKIVEGRLQEMEKIAEAVDASIKNVEKSIKDEVKSVQKVAKTTTAKKTPAADKPAPKPKGRPKKTQ
jgi:translation elongation factor EF-Ts